MKIPVVYKDSTERTVSKDELQYLLVTQQILYFRRSDGWVLVGRDEMRQRTMHFKGEDRRDQNIYARNLWY